MMNICAAVKETHTMVYNTASCVPRTASVANHSVAVSKETRNTDLTFLKNLNKKSCTPLWLMVHA
jgi:hypothetical protein